MFTDDEKVKWRTEFLTDGFVVVPGFLNDNELSNCVDHVERFIRDRCGSLPPEHMFFEDRAQPDSLKQIQQLSEHDPWFGNLIRKGRFRDIAELLLDGPVVPKNLQYFNKPAMIGQSTPAHQDGYYFMLDPCVAVTMWLALDRVDEENGCLKYVRGSHRLGIRKHGRTRTLGFSQAIAGFPTSLDLENEVAIPAQPGDLIVHHALTVHHAGRNASASRSRRALGFIYYSQRAKEDVTAHRAYQQMLASELLSEGKI